MWNRSDNQDVGLEAATIKRVRNSSLVQGFCAENVTGLKHCTEDADWYYKDTSGRGAIHRGRSDSESGRGHYGRENAGISTR